MTFRRRSKLDRFSIGVLVVSLVLFIEAAACYLIGSYLLLTAEGEPVPSFTFGEIGNIVGILGMITIPIFIATALIQNYRETKRETGRDIDNDHTEPGTAGGR